MNPFEKKISSLLRQVKNLHSCQQEFFKYNVQTVIYI